MRQHALLCSHKAKARSLWPQALLHCFFQILFTADVAGRALCAFSGDVFDHVYGGAYGPFCHLPGVHQIWFDPHASGPAWACPGQQKLILLGLPGTLLLRVKISSSCFLHYLSVRLFLYHTLIHPLPTILLCYVKGIFCRTNEKSRQEAPHVGQMENRVKRLPKGELLTCPYPVGNGESLMISWEYCQ